MRDPVETLDQTPLPAPPTPSFRALYRDNFGFVWSSLLRLGVPIATVEDALQDVFAIAHRRLSTFEGRSSVRSWLFGIVRRVAFRHRRTIERADRKLRAWAPHADSPHAESRVELDELVDQRQLSDLLLRALDELDRDKRAAITLHVFEDMSGPEVAQMLGLNVDTAYSRIKAGRRALQQTLEEMGVGPQRARLVKATARQTQPPKGAERRVAAALALRLGAGSSSAAAPAIATWKAVAAVLALGSVGLLGLELARDREAPPSPTAAIASRTEDRPPAQPQPTPPTLAPIEPPMADPPSPEAGPAPSPASPSPNDAAPTLRRAHDTAAPTFTPPTETDADALRREVALITSAKAALDRAEPQRALDELADHARSFARGQLVIEREAYRAVALCNLGQTAQGRAEAQLFLRRNPRAPLAARVAEACEIDRRL